MLPSDDLPERVAAAVAAIRERSPLAPSVAITLGSGLGGLADAPARATSIPTAEIPHWPRSTVAGHAGRLVLGEWRGVPVAVLAGRSHRYEGYTLDRVTFGVRVMHALGAGTIVLTNAVGGITASLSPGDLMLATDHINAIGRHGLFTPRELAERREGRRAPRVYDPGLADELSLAAAKAGVPLRLGVLLGSLGPAYETAAEIRAAARLGADAACMSTVHEATVAAQLGCRVASLSCVANLATGLAGRPLAHDEVTEAAGRATARLRAILEAWLDGLGGGNS